MTPNEVCIKYGKQKKGFNLSLCLIDSCTLIIKGNKKSLEFLGKLIVAQAEYSKDDGVQISPNGAGKTFFNKKSKIGLYIQRTPNKKV